jgi:LPXTG-site transpeptidase (sortase) family protein
VSRHRLPLRTDIGAGPGASHPTRVVDLGPAVYDEGEHRGSERAPRSLRIDDLGIDGAPVAPVGVNRAGELDVPGPHDIGWYRFGPSPGEAGVTVLAAHIAYNGIDGVFRHLDTLPPGAAIMVRMNDGADLAYRVTDVEQYPKDALPPRIWARGGTERLALVTCGGTFDRSRRSYRSNVVAWAEPA